MKTSPVTTLVLTLIATLLLLTACDQQSQSQQSHEGQQLVQEKTFSVYLPNGWTRSSTPPTGFDVEFEKTISSTGKAKLSILHNIATPSEECPPAALWTEQQYEERTRKLAPDAVFLRNKSPKVNGRILLDKVSSLTRKGNRVTLRYTQILAGRTTFTILCEAPEADWQSVLKELDGMISSLNFLKDSFWVAAIQGDQSTLKKCLKGGAKVNEPISPDGWTALHYAAKNGNEVMVKDLLDAGADANIAGHGQGSSVSIRPLFLVDFPLINLDRFRSLEKANAGLFDDDIKTTLNDPIVRELLSNPRAVERFQRIQAMLKERTKTN